MISAMDAFSYCSWLENDIASKIFDFVESRKYGASINEVNKFFRDNRINYAELPQYLKDKIDEIDVW
jgi:hypothetical protein